eukprot:4842805-Amphidinium_carterae.3
MLRSIRSVARSKRMSQEPEAEPLARQPLLERRSVSPVHVCAATACAATLSGVALHILRGSISLSGIHIGGADTWSALCCAQVFVGGQYVQGRDH